jgi:branched-chain amino acid transport system ATP-binding protein
MPDWSLSVRNLRVAYGGVIAVDEIDLDVPASACVALIGANGAGKTATLLAISGLIRHSRSASICLMGQQVENLPAETRARRGLGHVLQARHIFPNLTVHANLELGVHGGTNSLIRQRLDEVTELFPWLKSMKDLQGAALSGGQQQFLAIARAYVGHPKVLLLDEPSTGLAPQLVDRLVQVIGLIVGRGTAVLLAEQSLEVVTETASQVLVLSHGRILSHTTADDPRLDAIARDAYLR